MEAPVDSSAWSARPWLQDPECREKAPPLVSYLPSLFDLPSPAELAFRAIRTRSPAFFGPNRRAPIGAPAQCDRPMCRCFAGPPDLRLTAPATRPLRWTGR